MMIGHDRDGAIWIARFDCVVDICGEVFGYPVSKQTNRLLRFLSWSKTEVQLDQAGRWDGVTVSFSCVARLNPAHLYSWQEAICGGDVISFVYKEIFDACRGFDVVGSDRELCVVGEHLIGYLADRIIVPVDRQPVLIVVETCEKFAGFIGSIWCNASIETTMQIRISSTQCYRHIASPSKTCTDRRCVVPDDFPIADHHSITCEQIFVIMEKCFEVW